MIFASVVLAAIVLVFTVVLAFVGITYLVTRDEYKHYQKLNYAESREFFLNPDQGFYRTGGLKLYRNQSAKKSYNAPNDFQIVHLRVDISDFSAAVNGVADAELSETNLDELDEALSYYKQRGKNVIIRFCYAENFGDKPNQEPAVNMMMKHVEQLCSVLNKYPTTLTAIEAGMIGPWGEMHTSTIANKTVINELIDTFLSNTSEIPVLVRTPQMIYNYLGITFDEIETAEIEQGAYRLGMFNDGYLGSDSDLGTYTKNREKETAFIARQTEHLPYGGEVTIPNSRLHDIDKCLPEMFLINLSYLNYEWNTYVVQTKWKESKYTKKCGSDKLFYGASAYEYIRSHMGYRLVLRKSCFYLGANGLDIKLTIDNVGFGNFYRSKDATVYFVNGAGEVFSEQAGRFCGERAFDITVPVNLESGSYKVYLAISTLEEGSATYPVRFANDLWNDKLKANLIGSLSV